MNINEPSALQLIVTLFFIIFIIIIIQVGGSGFAAVKTDNFIIYGSYSSSMFPSVCVEAVESLGTQCYC